MHIGPRNASATSVSINELDGRIRTTPRSVQLWSPAHFTFFDLPSRISEVWSIAPRALTPVVELVVRSPHPVSTLRSNQRAAGVCRSIAGVGAHTIRDEVGWSGGWNRTDWVLQEGSDVGTDWPFGFVFVDMRQPFDRFRNLPEDGLAGLRLVRVTAVHAIPAVGIVGFCALPETS